jgi:hypothetical protein
VNTFPSIDNYCLVAGNIHRICSEDLGRTVVAGDVDVEIDLLEAPMRLREPQRSRQVAKTFLRLWLLSWQESGRPHLRFADERVPVTLMATVADPSVAELVLPPWPAFVVDLPRGALRAESSVSPAGDDIVRLHVRVNNAGKWSFLGCARDGTELLRYGLFTSDLVEPLPVGSETFTIDISDRNERILLLLGRLLVGLCLTLSDPRNLRERKGAKGKGLRAMSDPSRLTPSAFVVTSDIRVACRDVITDYVEGGGGRSPRVRTFVRGHWKRQRYGPKFALTKVIQIAPYWRGDETAQVMAQKRIAF